MKKIIFLIATMAYMFSTTGATVYIHHCMGNVVDWDFMKNDVDRCTTCSMEKDAENDCCKDEIKVLKIDEADKHPETADNQLSFKDVILPITYFALTQQDFTVNNKELPPINIPLNQTVPDLCVLHCTYLI